MLWDSARPREWNSYPTRANEREKLTPAEPHPMSIIPSFTQEYAEQQEQFAPR